MLKDAVKGKNDYYKNQFLGTVGHFFSSIFGSIKNANKLTENYKQALTEQKGEISNYFKDNILLVDKEEEEIFCEREW